MGPQHDRIYDEALRVVRSGEDLDHVPFYVGQRDWLALEKELLNLKRYTYSQRAPIWLPLEAVYVYGMRIKRK